MSAPPLARRHQRRGVRLLLPQSLHRRPLERRDRLRRSLTASTTEGVVAELVMACTGGAAITGWAIALNCSPTVIALLGALPFLAQIMQLPAAWLTSRLGARTSALVTVAASRQAFWPLVALPFVPLDEASRQWVLIAVAAVHHGCGILCNNAWVAWMGELVPARIRGRYFGQRSAIATAGGTLIALSVGWTLDVTAGTRVVTLAALSLLACVAGAVSTWLMSLKHSPSGAGPRPTPRLSALLRPLRDAAARRFLEYLVAWNFAVGCGAPFLSFYLAQDLGLGFGIVALHTAGTAAMRTLTGPWWGRRVDRIGPRAVLVATSFGIAASPLLWLAAGPGRAWPLILDVMLVGALTAGHSVAAFALPLSVAPSRERPFYHAAFALSGGAAFAGGALLAGRFVESAAHGAWLLSPGALLSPLHVAFVASAATRVLAAVIALRIEPVGVRSSAGSPAGAAPGEKLAGAVEGGSDEARRRAA